MTPCWGCVDVGAMLDPSWAMLGLRGSLPGPRRLMFKIGARLAHVGAVLGL